MFLKKVNSSTYLTDPNDKVKSRANFFVLFAFVFLVSQESYAAFQTEFKSDLPEMKASTSHLLQTNQTLQAYYSEFGESGIKVGIGSSFPLTVPDQVDEHLFWTRYFYRVCEVQKEEARLQAMFSNSSYAQKRLG